MPWTWAWLDSVTVSNKMQGMFVPAPSLCVPWWAHWAVRCDYYDIILLYTSWLLSMGKQVIPIDYYLLWLIVY